MDPVIRRQVGNVLREAVIGRTFDDADVAATLMVQLTDGLELTAMQQVAVCDRLAAMASLTRVLVRTLTPDPYRSQLPRLIDHATDAMAIKDTEGR